MQNWRTLTAAQRRELVEIIKVLRYGQSNYGARNREIRRIRAVHASFMRFG